MSKVTLLDTGAIRLLEWKHEPAEKFIGANQSHLYYQLGLSKPDIFTSSLYFAVRVHKVYENQFNGEVFKASAAVEFHIGYRHDAPTVAFLFDLVNRATFEFAKVFYEKVKNTNLRYHLIAKPNPEDLRKTLQESIDDWDAPAARFKERGGTRLEKFRDLPLIPEHKRYDEAHSATLEQRLSHKLFSNDPLTVEEENIIGDLQTFYSELNVKLATVDYASFTPEDLIGFKNYIHYAFNFHFLITNQLEVTSVLYRLVVNESVSGSNSSLMESRYLTYPPLAILQKIGKYNRASTSDSTLLYLTESVDTALKELKPPANKLVTIGIWSPKVRRKFTSYPIEHHPEAAKVNEEVAKGQQAVKTLTKQQHPMLAGYMNNYLNLLAREYSKPVNHHYEYLLSALLSENIFELNDPNPDFNFECIVYPSVGNNFQTRNLAIKPSVVDKEFQLIGAVEFKITRGYYERTPILTGNPASISVAEIKNYRTAKHISPEGSITW